MGERPLPTPRWRRDAGGGSARGAGNRVVRAHAQTRPALMLALGFIAAAAFAWLVTDRPWLPLHLFLAGGVVLAISGVTLMLTVTWSAAPAPSDRVVWCQRMCIVVGAAGVAFARRLRLADAVMVGAAVIYLAGLVLLAALLVVTVRRGIERRFDPAVGAYVAALAAGTVGVAFGARMAVDGTVLHLRHAHAVINALGLVGLVISGTLPFFAATVGRTRMATHTTAVRLAASVGWQVAAVAAAATGLVTGTDAVAAAGLGAYVVGIVGVVWLLPRPTRRQLRWAGPRLVALWAGATWWTVAVAAAAIDAARGAMVFPARWLAVLVVAGYAQILWGSLAYLLAMLRGGGHQRLTSGFATTRSWVALVAANVAGIGLVASVPVIVAPAIVVWVTDTAVRAALVGFGRARQRPPMPDGRGADARVQN